MKLDRLDRYESSFVLSSILSAIPLAETIILEPFIEKNSVTSSRLKHLLVVFPLGVRYGGKMFFIVHSSEHKH